jgi:hypothetical protein
VTTRTFTPAEANRTLPLVRRIVTEILEKGPRLRELVEGHRARVKGTKVAQQAMEPELHQRVNALEHDMRDLFEELERIGCSYKDGSFDTGLVDFPGEIEGKPVLLCWRSDEERVTWFHTLEAGFAGRRRIPESLLEVT